MDQNTRLLVTGGSGFIGTNAIEFYLSKGYTILNIDVKSPKLESQNGFWKKVDIRDLASLEEAVLDFKPTHVLHLAARTDLDENKNIEGYDSNTKGVENVIDVFNRCPSIKRVLFTSSMYVCIPGYDPKDYTDYAPHTVYGESKVLTEKIVKEKASSSYEWAIIRPTSIWGPWFGVPYNDFFHHVRKRTFFDIRGKTATKTYGFIYNAIYQVDTILFAESSKVNHKTFYIGDHPGLHIGEWGKEIARQMDIKLLPMPLFVLRLGGYFGDVLGLVGVKFPLQSFRMTNMTTDNVISLLKDTLAIAPEQPYSIPKGVEITLKWLREHDPAFRNS